MDKNHKLKEKTMEHLEEIPQCLLQAILPQSGFQPETRNSIKQSIKMEDAQVPQEAWHNLSLLLQTKVKSIVSKVSTDVRRTNLRWTFQPKNPPISYKPYLIPLKYQEFVDEETWLAGCISKSLSLWADPVIIVLRNQILHIPASNSCAWS